MRRLLIAAGAAALLAVGAGGAEAQTKLKVCFIYVGPHNDGGYSETHDIARQAVEKELGSRVETTYVETVPEGPDAERTLDRLAQSGCGMIFATSFGFMDPTVAVAKKYPNVKFEHATGFKKSDNLSIYNLRWYEGRYVMGIIDAGESGADSFIAGREVRREQWAFDQQLAAALKQEPLASSHAGYRLAWLRLTRT